MPVEQPGPVPTKAKAGHFQNFTELEQAAICLTAMVVRAGGRIIISPKDLNPDIGDGIVDINYLMSGEVVVEIVEP